LSIHGDIGSFIKQLDVKGLVVDGGWQQNLADAMAWSLAAMQTQSRRAVSAG
jgi:hypothetical protein